MNPIMRASTVCKILTLLNVAGGLTTREFALAAYTSKRGQQLSGSRVRAAGGVLGRLRARGLLRREDMKWQLTEAGTTFLNQPDSPHFKTTGCFGQELYCTAQQARLLHGVRQTDKQVTKAIFVLGRFVATSLLVSDGKYAPLMLDSELAEVTRLAAEMQRLAFAKLLAPTSTVEEEEKVLNTKIHSAIVAIKRHILSITQHWHCEITAVTVPDSRCVQEHVRFLLTVWSQMFPKALAIDCTGVPTCPNCHEAGTFDRQLFTCACGLQCHSDLARALAWCLPLLDSEVWRSQLKHMRLPDFNEER